MPAKPAPYDVLVAALRRQDPAAAPGEDPGPQLVAAVAGALRAGREPDRSALTLAVRLLAQTLAARAPGRTVELRVPPYAAVQCVAGPRHTRGTPPNVVEVEPAAFVALCTGDLAWEVAAGDGRLRASGGRTVAVADLLPLWTTGPAVAGGP